MLKDARKPAALLRLPRDPDRHGKRTEEAAETVQAMKTQWRNDRWMQLPPDAVA